MIREVDDYINASNQWPAEMSALRSVLLGCGLSEAIKWRKPCYVDPNTDANIAIMQEMKGFLALMFFKGSLVDDPESLLEKQGPNSRSAMRLCLRSPAEVSELSAAIEHLVSSALAVEAEGLEVGPAPEPELVSERGQGPQRQVRPNRHSLRDR